MTDRLAHRPIASTHFFQPFSSACATRRVTACIRSRARPWQRHHGAVVDAASAVRFIPAGAGNAMRPMPPDIWSNSLTVTPNAIIEVDMRC